MKHLSNTRQRATEDLMSDTGNFDNNCISRAITNPNGDVLSGHLWVQVADGSGCR
jgi:hypothetical protein